MTIFIDTGAFLARYIMKDQHHQAAISRWDKLHKAKEKFSTSNFVLDEMITLLGRWVGAEFALEKAQFIYSSESFIILRPEEVDEIQALEFYRKLSDKKIGFTDCVSCALMKRYKIKKVFSYDRHFTDAGFTRIY